jgi:hypothetical protein
MSDELTTLAHSILLEAASSPHGITVDLEPTEPIPNLAHVAKDRLRAAVLADAELHGLTIAFSPDNPEGELWIMHREELKSAAPTTPG